MSTVFQEFCGAALMPKKSQYNHPGLHVNCLRRSEIPGITEERVKSRTFLPVEVNHKEKSKLWAGDDRGKKR